MDWHSSSTIQQPLLSNTPAWHSAINPKTLKASALASRKANRVFQWLRFRKIIHLPQICDSKIRTLSHFARARQHVMQRYAEALRITMSYDTFSARFTQCIRWLSPKKQVNPLLIALALRNKKAWGIQNWWESISELLFETTSGSGSYKRLIKTLDERTRANNKWFEQEGKTFEYYFLKSSCSTLMQSKSSSWTRSNIRKDWPLYGNWQSH